MKICYLSDQFSSIASGVGTYATNLLHGISQAKHEITLITFDSPEPVDWKLFRIIRLPQGWKYSAHPSWIMKSRRFAQALNQLMHTEKFDVIHFLDARESFFAKNDASSVIGTMNDNYFTDVPSSPYAMKPHYYDWIKRWLYYKTVHHFEKSLLPKLAHIITCSNAVEQSIRSAYGISQQKISTVYYGLENQKGRQILASNKPFQIAFIGGNAQRKGLPLLTKAAKLLHPKFPGFKVHVLGANPMMKHLENRCRAEGLSSSFQFLGQTPHHKVLEILKNSTLYVMPSLMEGFGLTFLEAMQAGVPVIGGNVGGTKELIQNGENGFLVNPTDPAELAQKITRLLEDKSLQRKFRENGFKTAARFTQARMVRETFAVYEKTIRAFPKT